MRLLKRHRVSLVLLVLLVLVGVLVVHRFKDQQARAVTRARPDVLVGVVSPARRDLDVKLAFTADILPDNDARQAQRLKTLFERGLVSATDYENARTNAESSSASVRAAEAQLRVAEVSVTTQESQVRCSIPSSSCSRSPSG